MLYFHKYILAWILSSEEKGVLIKKQIVTHLYNERHAERERETNYSVPSLQFYPTD